MSRSIPGGEVIKLRAQFKDDLGKVTETLALPVVHIFKPGVDTSNNTLQHATGTSIFLGQGVYEFSFTVPCDEPGIWSDKWVADLTCQALSEILTFTVVEEAGTLASYDSPQLSSNNRVVVTILPGVAASTGEVLEEEIKIEFLTPISPSYTNVLKVQLEVGSLVNEIKDLTSIMAILESSIEADALTFSSTEINSELFKHARREYVTAASAYKLVSNVGGSLLKSKTLGDLSVTYDTGSHKEILDYLQEMMRKWGDQLMSGGGARTVRNPKMVIKGVYDVDRPIFDRMWETTSTTNKYPMANSSQTTDNIRRSLRTRKKRWW